MVLCVRSEKKTKVELLEIYLPFPEKQPESTVQPKMKKKKPNPNFLISNNNFDYIFRKEIFDYFMHGDVEAALYWISNDIIYIFCIMLYASELKNLVLYTYINHSIMDKLFASQYQIVGGLWMRNFSKLMVCNSCIDF
jgi:hypothetical protein